MIDTMTPCSATKCATIEERRKAPMSLPVRVDELLGMAGSADKLIEHRRPQPIRIKHLLDQTKSCEKQPVVPSRRATLCPIHASNVRRNLYNGPANQAAPCTSNVQNTMTERVSKSISHPVKVKYILESCEKSWIDKTTAPECDIVNQRTSTVRRNLHSVTSSPVPPRRVIKKSMAPNDTQRNQFNESQKIVKQNNEKSTKVEASQIPSRKSYLLPPNSIRDNYISLQVNEITDEQSSNSNPSEMRNISNSEQIFKEKDLELEHIIENNHIETIFQDKCPSNPTPNSDFVEPGSLRKFEDNFQDRVEYSRPTVIINLATSTVAKNSNSTDSTVAKNPSLTTSTVAKNSNSNDSTVAKNFNLSSVSSDESDFALSRPPLQELNKNSTMPAIRIDQTDTSLDDLLRDTRASNRDDSRHSDLPLTSFLNDRDDTENLLANMDPRTSSWLRANLKICIQTTEENLFSMRRMLKTIDDILKNRVPPVVVDDNDEVFEVNKETDRNDVLEQYTGDDDKENLTVKNVESNKTEITESSEKTRRRSARLAARSPKNSDDSFLMAEAMLNITHKKPKVITPRKKSPAKRNIVDVRNRKSIREYMALKSSMGFLQTPELKGLPTPNKDMTGTPAIRRATEQALSRRLWNQLNDLYDDSPK